MIPADKREVLAILRRLINRVRGDESIDEIDDAFADMEQEIDRIEKEIEPCQDDNAASPKPVPQDATGNRGTSGSGAGSQPSRTIDPCPNPTSAKCTR